MSSLLELLTQKQPQFQTHQALVVLDLQNDFLLPDGKLPVSSRSGFLGRIQKLVSIFRENAGDIIWVRSSYEADRPVNDATDEAEAVVTSVEGNVNGSPEESSEETTKDSSPSNALKSAGRALDIFKKISRKGSQSQADLKAASTDEPEHFLSSTPNRPPCCVPNTKGIEFTEGIKESIDPAADVLVNKTYYSAFNSTSLLMTLRTRLITELYICGCLTNVSVYATALDAARHGLTINIIEDCVGYRKASRHREAIRQMVEVMGAFTVTSTELLNELAEQESDEEGAKDGERGRSTAADGEELSEMVKNMRLSVSSSLYSTNPDGTKSAETKRTVDDGTSTVGTPRRESEYVTKLGPPSPTPDHPLRSKRSGKLQKKPPVAEQPEVPDVPEDHGRTLKYRRSKIRMRKREPSRPRDSIAVMGEQTPPTPKQDTEEKSKKPSRLASIIRKSTDEPPPSPHLSPPSAQKEERGKRPSRLGSIIRKSTEEPPSSPLLSPPPVSPRGSDGSGVARLINSREGSTGPASNVSSPSRGSSRGSEIRSLDQQVASPMASPRADKSEFSKAETRSPVAAAAASNLSRQASTDSVARSRATSKTTSHVSLPMQKPESTVGEGDSFLSTNVLPSSLSASIFQDLYDEVRWQTMHHQTGAVPRLVCVQGDLGQDGSQPLYRHPTDHALPLLHFSPAVQTVRSYVEKVVNHPLNHVLIQLYRSGQDYISEHSDKTLDIVRGSSIVNASFGAQRTMRLRTKKSALNQQSVSFSEAARQTHRIPLPHNSAFVLGQDTNMRWLHGINADKRPTHERSDAEKAYSGMRISLTFRHIGTFLNAEGTLIWGQGASGKQRDAARPVVSNDLRRTEAMIRAFGKENQATEFDWTETYGAGFDVLHFRKGAGAESGPNACLLFLSNDAVENGQVMLYLDEAGIDYAAIEAPTKLSDDRMGCLRKVCFRDSDPLHTEVTGALAVLLYLDRLRPLPHRVTVDGVDEKPVETRASIARTYELLGLLTEAVEGVRKGEKWLVSGIEPYLGPDGYVAGRGFGFADCAYFPALEKCWENWDEAVDGEAPKVKAYLERIRQRIKSRRQRAKQSSEELRRELSVASLRSR